MHQKVGVAETVVINLFVLHRADGIAIFLAGGPGDAVRVLQISAGRAHPDVHSSQARKRGVQYGGAGLCVRNVIQCRKIHGGDIVFFRILCNPIQGFGKRYVLALDFRQMHDCAGANVRNPIAICNAAKPVVA